MGFKDALFIILIDLGEVGGGHVGMDGRNTDSNLLCGMIQKLAPELYQMSSKYLRS